MNKSLFICLEGVDGSGKSTQVKLLESKLKELYPSRGITVVRNPGQTELGRKYIELLNDDCSAEMQLLAFLADGITSYKQVVLPAILRGDIIISDRGLTSLLVYQVYAVHKLASEDKPQSHDSEGILYNKINNTLKIIGDLMHTVHNGYNLTEDNLEALRSHESLLLYLSCPLEETIKRRNIRNAGKEIDRFESLSDNFYGYVIDGYNYVFEKFLEVETIESEAKEIVHKAILEHVIKLI